MTPEASNRMRLFSSVTMLLATSFQASARADEKNRLPGFFAGEGFAYTFSVGAIDAGRARISVGKPVMKNGRRTLTVIGDAHSAPWLALMARIDDDYKVELDVDTLSPRKLDLVEKGLRERTLAITLDRAGTGTRVHVDSVKPKEQRHETHSVVGAPVEPAAGLFQLRATPWHEGEKVEMIAFDGPAFYRATATGKRETMERQGTKIDAIRIEIEAQRIDDRGRVAKQPPRHATLWLSDDEKRIPYRMAGETDFGHCELELVSYREGLHQPQAHAKRSSRVAETAP